MSDKFDLEKAMIRGLDYYAKRLDAILSNNDSLTSKADVLKEDLKLELENITAIKKVIPDHLVVQPKAESDRKINRYRYLLCRALSFYVMDLRKTKLEIKNIMLSADIEIPSNTLDMEITCLERYMNSELCISEKMKNGKDPSKEGINYSPGV